MKTKINSFVISIIGFLLLSAFQSYRSEVLIGSWKLTSLTAEYPKSMTGKAKTDAVNDVKGTNERLKKTSFVFTKDGHLSYANHIGTFVMSVDGKTVTFINDTKEKSIANIIKLTPHELIFTRVDNGITQTFHLAK